VLPSLRTPRERLHAMYQMHEDGAMSGNSSYILSGEQGTIGLQLD
jgi:hypothetical protein